MCPACPVVFIGRISQVASWPILQTERDSSVSRRHLFHGLLTAWPGHALPWSRVAHTSSTLVTYHLLHILALPGTPWAAYQTVKWPWALPGVTISCSSFTTASLLHFPVSSNPCLLNQLCVSDLSWIPSPYYYGLQETTFTFFQDFWKFALANVYSTPPTTCQALF